jgi:hypothetical protein
VASCKVVSWKVASCKVASCMGILSLAGEQETQSAFGRRLSDRRPG